ncbi:MAG: aldehyde ferredoxin oxidoreductase family protein [Anaerolineaceae bacterium]
MHGYIGKILWVDLSTGRIEEETIPDGVYETLLSGVGLGAYILYRDIPSRADALGPENILGFVSGLLTGTGSVNTGRWMAVAKSPLTGGWGDANCGGRLSPAIKQCGYDGIFFKGQAEKPVYLFIDSKTAELRSAEHLWGLDAVETEERLQAEIPTRKKPAVAVIGTAAEKLSLISGICTDGGRIAARSGVGAVMGSKRLKAVVLAGNKPVGGADPAASKALSRKLSAKVRRLNMPAWMPSSLLSLAGSLMGKMKTAAPMDGMMVAMMMKRYGTVANNGMGAASGDSPLKNWKGSVVDFNRGHYSRLEPDRVLQRETKKYHCVECVLGCGGVCDIRDLDGGKFTITHKPEYETCAAFGGLVMNKDLDAIFYINELLNRAGMDSISAGGTVAFAIECYQQGILTPEMTFGLELRWGDAKAIIALVKLMIAREGIGDLLADGVKAAAQKLGARAAEFAIHAGGQEPGMHDSRMDPLLGIHFSADPTPGRHTIGSGQYYDTMRLWEKVTWAPRSGTYAKAEEYIPSEKTALKTVAMSCYKELNDGAGGCFFALVLGVNHWNLFEWLNAAAGWNKTPDEYMEIGKRIQTLRQMFNIKHGVDPRRMIMHDRMAGRPPLKAGPLKGRTVPIDKMVRLHWKAFGWDERTGVPTDETLAALGLEPLPAEAAA